MLFGNQETWHNSTLSDSRGSVRYQLCAAAFLPFMGGMEGSHKVVKFDLELLLHFHNEPQVHGS